MNLRLPLAASAFVAAALLAPAARATPRPLPFTYTTETLGKGELEIEQFADLTPLRARAASSGEDVWYAATQFQTELEYGITDRLELGLYFVVVPTPAGLTSTGEMTEATGVKQRLRY